MRPRETFIGQPIRSLQTMLRILSEDDTMLPTLVPDGIFGPQTRHAIYAFQQKYGIPATGVSDQATWERIVEEHEKSLIRISPAEPLQLIFNPNQIIRRNEYHPYLFLVQSMLGVLATTYGQFSAPSITGILDQPTSDAIISFQGLSALPQTGELDKITWKHLALQYPLAVNIQQTQNRTYR